MALAEALTQPVFRWAGLSEAHPTVRDMTRGADAELIGYLADDHDQARLVLRDVSDTHAALAALKRAAAAVWSLPHPDEPGCALPNWCDTALEDGHAVLHMDAKDGAGQIDQLAATILRAVDEAGAGGRLEPFPP